MFDKLVLEVKSKFANNFSRRLFRKYRKCEQTDVDCIGGMFPRVYRQNKCTNIELTSISSSGFALIDPEYLLSVVDKFVRVTNPDRENIYRYGVGLQVGNNKNYNLCKI